MIQHRRSAVAVRHVAFEDVGLLAPVMEREGWDVSFCEAAVDDLRHDSIRNANLPVILGGPIGAYETDAYPFLTSEIALIEHRLSRELPTLGICLGSQLMARALGSRVFAGQVKEIGWGVDRRGGRFVPEPASGRGFGGSALARRQFRPAQGRAK